MSDKLYRMISGIFVLSLVLVSGSTLTRPSLTSELNPLLQMIQLFSQPHPHLKHCSLKVLGVQAEL